MMKNRFINVLVVNLSNGRFGDTHKALNDSFYNLWVSLFFPFTREICLNKAYKEMKKDVRRKIPRHWKW